MIRIAIGLILALLFHYTYGGELIVSGVYQGKNIYVQNPATEEKNVFCTQQVYVNNKLVVTNPSTSAFEVDLSHLNINQPLVIKILSRESCEPKIINPQVIREKSQFEFLSVLCDQNLLRWFTRGEAGQGKFFIEHYLNNKWVIVQAVDADGGHGRDRSYAVQVNPITGLNRFRLKYLPPEGTIQFSRPVEIHGPAEEPVTFYPTRVTDKIILSRETDYEVLDSQGNAVVKGTGREIELGDLTSGLYYLNIENRKEKFIKK
jgi:hypothetical protein